MIDQCPFCSLDFEKIRTIASNDLVHVILSNPRLLPGHTLVMPRRHVEHPNDLTEVELLAIFKQINLVRARMLEAIATGVDIRQNYRPFIKQGRTKVDHVHFHVLPRTNKDELYQKSMRFEHEVFADLPESERKQMLDLLTG